MDKCGLLPYIFPELSALKGVETKEGIGHKDNFAHTLMVLDRLSKTTDNLWLRWSALFQCAAAFFMFYSIDPRDWLVFVLAGAVLQLYVSIMVPVAIRKAAKK